MGQILIINSAEPEVHDFYTSIERILQKLPVSYNSVQYKECLNINFNDWDGVIISGSPQGDDIVEHHQEYFEWVKIYEKPVMGICAGHHIIGYKYGAEYLYSVEPESGTSEIEILVDDPIFEGLPRKFMVHQMHNDSITLPSGFIHLAKSEKCKVQSMRHKDKPLYTFQFHPEYLNHELFQTFVKRVCFC